MLHIYGSIENTRDFCISFTFKNVKEIINKFSCEINMQLNNLNSFRNINNWIWNTIFWKIYYVKKKKKSEQNAFKDHPFCFEKIIVILDNSQMHTI